MRHYAVGIRGWVEIIRSARPPKRSATALRIETKAFKRVWHEDLGGWNGGFYTEELAPVKKVIKFYSWKGGNVVTRMKSPSFITKTGIRVGPGEIMLLTPEQLQLVLGTKKGG